MEPPQLLQLLIFVLLLLCSTDAEDPTNSSHKSSLKSHLIAIFAVVDVIGLIIVLWLFFLYYKKAKKLREEKRMKRDYKDEQEEGKQEIEAGEREVGSGKGEGEGEGKLIFVRNEASLELDDLLKASAEGLGRGNFGNTYKAMLEGELIVVVKRFKDLRPLSCGEFGRHMKLIAALDHPNLLPPLAYYCSSDEKLVVYKYAANGNLFDRLHGGRGQNRIPFRWNSRLLVAQAVARALEHLHLNSKTETKVPHGDLKSTNVLFNEDNTVLVCDYGLASIIAFPIAAQRMVSYRSPEFHSQRKVSKKSDVWCYGSLLLELLTGRIPSHTAPEGNGVDICSWAHRAVREEWTEEIFDHEICTRRSTYQGMLSLMQIAIRCCSKAPEERPDMSEVTKEVESIKPVGGEEDDDFSFDRSSYTDDSMSTNPSIILADA